MRDDELWIQLRERMKTVQTDTSAEEVVQWLEEQGVAEYDARRRVQFLMVQATGVDLQEVSI